MTESLPMVSYSPLLPPRVSTPCLRLRRRPPLLSQTTLPPPYAASTSCQTTDNASRNFKEPPWVPAPPLGFVVGEGSTEPPDPPDPPDPPSERLSEICFRSTATDQALLFTSSLLVVPTMFPDPVQHHQSCNLLLHTEISATTICHGYQTSRPLACLGRYGNRELLDLVSDGLERLGDISLWSTQFIYVNPLEQKPLL